MIFDACRNNPFPGAERAMERGLAVVGAVQPPQSIIIYATAPGKTAQDGSGRNGVFTAALLKHIADSDLDIELMIRRVRDEVMAATGAVQVPWQNSSISGAGFFFSKKEPSVVSAQAPGATASSLSSGKSTGTLKITSDPSGAQVLVDDSEVYQTPISLELPPGAHSFELKEARINNLYYSAQDPQWITLTAGAEARIPVTLKPIMATLQLRLIPRGYTVFVNGEKKGTTPLSEIEVQAGNLTVRFEKNGEQSRIIQRVIFPKGSAAISWGTTRDFAIELARKSIDLDGRTDSWEGIDPIYEPSATTMNSFLKQQAFGVKAIYICRDEKFLFWRVDFNESNPFVKRPNGLGKGLTLQIAPYMEAARRAFNMAVTYNRDGNKTDSYLESWSDDTKKSSKIADSVIMTKQGKDMIVAKLDIKWVNKYATEIGNLQFTLTNLNNSFQWEEATKVRMDLGFVDFSK